MQSPLWFALKVRPKSEWQVSAKLGAKGYELFLPTYKSERRWSDRTKTLELPLFPGYVFCQFDLATRLPILTTPGVLFIVGSGKTPEAIDQEEIESIRTMVRTGVGLNPHPYVNVGQRVRVEHGALAGLTGLVIQTKGQTRLVVSVSLLMRSVSVEIDRNWVVPINDAGQGSGLILQDRSEGADARN